MEGKNDYSNVQVRPVTVSELRKIVEELPDGILLPARAGTAVFPSLRKGC